MENENIRKAPSPEDVISSENESSDTQPQCGVESQTQSTFGENIKTVCPVIAMSNGRRYQERLKRISVMDNSARPISLRFGPPHKNRLHSSKRRTSARCDKTVSLNKTSPVETVEESIAYAKSLSAKKDYTPPDMVETEAVSPKSRSLVLPNKKTIKKFSRKLLISLHKAVQAGENRTAGYSSPTLTAEGGRVAVEPPTPSRPWQIPKSGKSKWNTKHGKSPRKRHNLESADQMLKKSDITQKKSDENSDTAINIPTVPLLRSISDITRTDGVPFTDTVVIDTRNKQDALQGSVFRRVENIDDILFAEWCRLEPEWSAFHIDEAIVKKQIFDNIFQKILAKTVEEYKKTVLSTTK